MSGEENKELIRRVVEEVRNRGNFDAMDRYYARDHILHSVPPTGADFGREQFKQVMRTIRGGFPDLSAHIDLRLAEGELVATRLTSSGTHTRPYFIVEPTGKTVKLTEIYIDRIRDGKIVETWFESFGQGYYYRLTGRPVPVRRTS
ncbi:MAG: ester cyclase [Candidatus Limnocylindria bacterium]